MGRNSQMCCVSNCGKTRLDNLTLHQFPNPIKEPERFRTWMYSIGGDVLALDNQYVFNYRRVCHIHFEQKYVTWHGRLSAIAVPTLHLKDFPQQCRNVHSQPLTKIDESPQTVLRDFCESIETKDIQEEEVFSWQKTDFIQTDETEDPTLAPVSEKPKLPEDVVTLSMFCEEPEPPSEPCESVAAVVPEDVGYQCKDCEAVVDGFQFWCVSCGRGALCGACAACVSHDSHYVLRTPQGVTREQTKAVLAAIRLQLQKEELLTLYETDENGVKVEIKNELEEPPSSLPAPAEPDPLGPLDPLAIGTKNAEPQSEEPLYEESPNEDSLTEETLQEEPLIVEPLAEQPLYEKHLSELPFFAEPLTEESYTEEYLSDESQIEESLTEEHLSKESLTEEVLIEEHRSDDIMTKQALTEHRSDSIVEFVEEETVDHRPCKRPRLMEHQRRKRPNSRGNNVVQPHSLVKFCPNIERTQTLVMISPCDQEGSQTFLQLSSSDLSELQTVLQVSPSDLTELQTVLQASPSDLTESETVLQINSSDLRPLQIALQVTPSEFTELQTVLQVSPSDNTKLENVLQVSRSDPKELQTTLEVTPHLTELKSVSQVNPSDLRESRTILKIQPNILRKSKKQPSKSKMTRNP